MSPYTGAFAVRYGIANDLITPFWRMVLGLAVAAGIAIAGDRMIGKGWHWFGGGIVGLGLMLGYASLYGAFIATPPVLGQTASFAGMALITGLGLWLSVRRDHLPVAALALIGGLATPILVSNGAGSRDALFAYLLILDAGVLAATFFRRWRLLEALALVATAGYVAIFLAQRGPDPVMGGWILAAWAIFLVNQIIWRRTGTVPVESALAAIGNGVLSLAGLAIAADGHAFLGTTTILAVGCVYGWLAWPTGIFRNDRIVRDAAAGLAALAAAMALATCWAPASARAIGWTVEGAILWWLARRDGQDRLAWWGHAALAVGLIAALVDAAYLPQGSFLDAGWLVGCLPVAALIAAAWFALRPGTPWRQAGHAAMVAAVGLLGLRVAMVDREAAPQAIALAIIAASVAALPARLRPAGMLAGFGLLVIAASRAGMSTTDLASHAWLNLSSAAWLAVAAVPVLWMSRLPAPIVPAVVPVVAWWIGIGASIQAFAQVATPGEDGGGLPVAASAWAAVAAGILVFSQQPVLRAATALPALGVAALLALVGAVLHGQAAPWWNADVLAALVVAAAPAVLLTRLPDGCRGWVVPVVAWWLGVVAHLQTLHGGRDSMVQGLVWAGVAAAIGLLARPGIPLMAALPAVLVGVVCAVIGECQGAGHGLIVSGLALTAAMVLLAARLPALSTSLLVAAGGWTMTVLHLELVRALPEDPAASAGWGTGTLLAALGWAAAGTAASWGLGRWQAGRVFALSATAVAAGSIAAGWMEPSISPPLAHPLLVASILVAVTLIHAGRSSPQPAIRVAAALWIVVAATVEAWISAGAFGFASTGRIAAITLAWSLTAVAALIVGMHLGSRRLRQAALALFALTLAKLVLIDLSHLKDLARIGSFLAAGLLLLAGSWAWQRLERRMRRP